MHHISPNLQRTGMLCFKCREQRNISAGGKAFGAYTAGRDNWKNCECTYRVCGGDDQIPEKWYSILAAGISGHRGGLAGSQNIRR